MSTILSSTPTTVTRQLYHLLMLSTKQSLASVLLTPPVIRCLECLNHSDLSENETLNRVAAELSGLPERENFTMANFTYANSAVLSLMFQHLHNTMFHGIAVSCVPWRLNLCQV